MTILRLLELCFQEGRQKQRPALPRHCITTTQPTDVQNQRKGRAETSSSPENNSGNTEKQRKTAGEQHRSTLESTIHRPLQPAQAAQTAGSTAATPGRTSPAPWSPAPWSETPPAKQIVARLLPRLPRLPHQIGIELGYPFGGHSHAGLFQKVGQQPKSTLSQD